MRRHTNLSLLAGLGFALFLPACSRDPKPGTPEAAAAGERMVRSMSDTLARAKTLTFESSERIEVIAPSGEKRSLHFSRKVAVRRPDALYFELLAEGGEAFHLAAYYRGRTLVLRDLLDGTWAQTEVPGSIDEMLDAVILQFGLPVPVGDVISSSPYDAIIGSSARGGLVAWDTVDQIPGAELAYADAVVGVRLWLPRSGPPLPRRLEINYKQSPVPLVTQLNFSNWKLDVPLPEDTFAFQPSPNSRTAAFGDLVSRMVARTLPQEAHANSPAPSDSKAAKGSGERQQF